MSVFAENLDGAAVLSDVCSQLGLSCVAPASLPKISVILDGADGETAIREVCRQLGVGVRLEGKLLIISKDEDRKESFGVFFPGQDSPEVFAEAARGVLGDSAEVRPVGQRVVVSGSRDAIERMQALVEQMSAAASDTWMLDVCLVSVGRSVRRDAGLDWTVAAGVGVELNAGTGRVNVSGPVFGARAAAAVGVVLRAVEEGREASAVTRGSLLVVEGRKASFQQGENVPLPRRVVSDNGTVTVVGYDNVTTGFELAADASRVPAGVLLNLRPRLSGITGFQGEQPIIAERFVESTVELASGEWVVISGLDDVTDSRSYLGLPNAPARRGLAADRTSIERRTLVVLVRATRVRAGGPTAGKGPA